MIAQFFLGTLGISALATIGCLLADHTEIGAGLASLVKGEIE